MRGRGWGHRTVSLNETGGSAVTLLLLFYRLLLVFSPPPAEDAVKERFGHSELLVEDKRPPSWAFQNAREAPCGSADWRARYLV